MLQEEPDSTCRREYQRSDWGFKPRTSVAPTPLPFPLPPTKVDKSMGVVQTTDNHSHEVSRAGSADEKVASLRAYHRARGLCQLCAKNWFRRHKCVATVQVHAVQELWEISTDQRGCFQ
jgi:hypothetical protein